MKAVSKIILGVVLTAGLTASMTSMADRWTGASAGAGMAMRDVDAYGERAQFATVDGGSVDTFSTRIESYYHGVNFGTTVAKMSGATSSLELGDHLKIGSQTATVTSLVGPYDEVAGTAGRNDVILVSGAGKIAGTVRIENAATAGKNSKTSLKCMQGYHPEGQFCIKNPTCTKGLSYDVFAGKCAQIDCATAGSSSGHRQC